VTLAAELALAGLAGVLLNLTPCVLPAMPVKIRTILRESGSEASHRVEAAIAFALGSLAFFLALGGLTAWLHWSWGSLFQSRGFLAFLVLLLAGFAIITYRDVSIPVPSFAYTLRGHRLMEPALAGMLGAVLATPCAGPFLGGVLAYTLTRPESVTLGIFAAVGLGLALPYIVILLWPRLLGRLPSAGAWSLRVRQGLAFVLLAAAVFFAGSLVDGAVARGLWIAWAGLFAAWAVFAAVRDSGWRSRAVVGVFVALFGGSALGLGTGAPTGAIGWRAYTADRSAAAVATGRPQLIEFTADWCINCKVLERTTYGDPDVRHALRATDTLALRADLTRPDAALTRVLNRFGGAALPFAVVLDRDGAVVERFDGMFGAATLRDALLEAGAQTGRSE